MSGGSSGGGGGSGGGSSGCGSGGGSGGGELVDGGVDIILVVVEMGLWWEW